MSSVNDPHLLVLSFMLIVGRVGAFVATIPLFGDRRLPNQVKIGLVLALSTLWLVQNGENPTTITAVRTIATSHWLAYVVALISEMLMGAVLGFAFSLFLLPLRIAGAYIGQEMGLTFATLASPTSAESTNVVSQFMEAVGILLLLSLDVHHLFLAAMDLSFQRWPLGAGWAPLPTSALIHGVDRSHHLGLLIAAPVGVCLFITMIALLLLARTVPQLNLFSIGLAIRIAAGFCALLLFLPEVVSVTQGVYADMTGFVYLLLAM
ncbi:MAG: type III secretion protein [Planctomycetaceae bacterium]|nr:MAG: type III secretion protein [Planctomycetaceae bacterium]